MKTILLSITSILFFGTSSFSQDTKSDTTKINISNKTIIIISPEADSIEVIVDENEHNKACLDQQLSRWAGFYMGVNGLLTKNNSLSLPNQYNFLDIDYSKSLNFSLNFMEKRFNLGTPHVGITTGMGIEFNRYEFKRNIKVNYDNDSVWGSIDTNFIYTKNFLKSTYIQVPLMLSFLSSKYEGKGFHLAAGVIGSYRIGSKMKVKYESDGNNNKDRTTGHYNINPFKLSLTTRLGYKNFVVFANYGLTSFFEKNKGPELYPFSFGISIIPF